MRKKLLRTRFLSGLVLVLFLIGCAPKPGGGGTWDTTQWFVSTGGNDNSHCHTFLAPCRTIATAVERAVDGDTIYISEGTFNENLVINKSLSLVGQGEVKTILDGSGISNTVIIGDSLSTGIPDENPDLEVSLSSLTVQNGMATYPNMGNADAGAGISVENGHLTLWAVTISDNTAAIGAGIYIHYLRRVTADHVMIKHNDSVGTEGDNSAGGIYNSGILDMTNSIIVNNTTELDGGGIVNSVSGILTLDRCAILSNSAGRVGGGILNNGGELRIYDTAFDANTADIGAGIASINGQVDLERNTFSVNHATTYGGALALIDHAIFDATNNTFDGNRATFGGAIALGNPPDFPLFAVNYPPSEPVFNGYNLTISDNQAAPNLGGGIYNQANASVILYNVLFSENIGLGCAGTLTGNNNMSSDASCVFNGVNNSANQDALLGPLVFDGGLTMTRTLLPGSPAIDAGAGNGPIIPSSDQRGVHRPQDGNGDGVFAIDIGAVEVKGEPAQIVPPSGPLGPVFIPDLNAYCHSGPDVLFSSVSLAMEGQSYPIDGRNAENDWFYIMITPQVGCWVASDLGTTTGETEPVRILVVPQTPTITPIPSIVCSAYTTRESCDVSACKWLDGTCVNR